MRCWKQHFLVRFAGGAASNGASILPLFCDLAVPVDFLNPAWKSEEQWEA
jgi:hypothetical protein